jgi:hypothetical protein
VPYYYLAAQLPALIYGQPVPMTSSSFKELCSTKLSSSDFALLDWCTLDPANRQVASSSFIDGWYAWEWTLRLNLTRYRATRLKRDGSADPPEYPADAAYIAKTAMSIESPLEAEIFLDESRWKAIELLQGIQYFHINTIYAYLLKLLLMERRAGFVAEEGFTEYKRLYAAIMEGAK